MNRILSLPLHRASLLADPVLVHGPRGAGKTDLLRREFPAHTYIALDDPADRQRARSDPQAFLARLRGPAIIDDLQRVPELWPYIPAARRLILASSVKLSLPIETFELYPPTQAEREGRAPMSLEMLGRFAPAKIACGPRPPPPPNRSWLHRDVHNLVLLRDLDRFEFFLRNAESRSGQVLDMQAIANECDLSHRTVTRWLEVLDACFVTFRLPASTLDFGRRLVRSPKLHFFDSASVESQAIAQLYCNARHTGHTPDLTYWRDSNGSEMSLIVGTDSAPLMPVYIASEPDPPGAARLRRWMNLAGVHQGAIISQKAGRLSRGGILSYAVSQL